MGPLLTLIEIEEMRAALQRGDAQVECTLDLGRTMTSILLEKDAWKWQDKSFPYLANGNARTIYYWNGNVFQPASRYTTALIKLVPTAWGPPTFEIDGIKMLPTAQVSPYADAERKVALIQPQGKAILDTCGGLGYFAAWCAQGRAARVLSYEKNPDVIWLRGINPWSPPVNEILTLANADIAEKIASLPNASVDAILHDPPRFGIAGELYSQVFYDHLARVIKRQGKLFHYTGSPNKLTSGRDVPNEVSKRLRNAGFDTQLLGDGVLAVKK
ncbi:MAG: SAM-dependent methyltransferase [Pseudomonadota bacterium]